MKYTQKTKPINHQTVTANQTKFSKALSSNVIPSFTANGARTLSSSGDAILNFFSVSGAMRSRSDQEIINLFQNAFNENAELAVRALFYARDARGGQGERRTFTICLNWLRQYHYDVFSKVVVLVPEYGYWKDILHYNDDVIVIDLVKNTLSSDLSALERGQPVSLLAKWMPSENASSKSARASARVWARELGLTSRIYRKTLSKLRESSNVVERPMSANCWDQITYENVPSKAIFNYRKAFARHDNEGYTRYLSKVEKGEAKINTSVIYPHEIISKVLNRSYGANTINEDPTLNLMWNNLPDYFNGQQENSIVVADVSGSMYTFGKSNDPINMSIALAIYAAQRNTGPFHNKFLTFSANPSLVNLQGNTIREITNNLSRADWGMNTNVEAIFRLILDTAINFNISQEEMVKRIYIVSDMQFDIASTGNQSSHFNSMKKLYADAGYQLPQLVYWNVNSHRDGNYHVSSGEAGTILVSGASPSLFQDIIQLDFKTPVDFMLQVLNKPRYSCITIS